MKRTWIESMGAVRGVAIRVALIAGFASCQSNLMAAEDWRPAQLWVVGDDLAVWVVGQSTAGPGVYPIVQMWRGAAVQGGVLLPRQLPRLPPISGDALFVGADAEALRILFTDLSQTDYSPKRGAMSGPRWHDQASGPPAAWAGDSTRGIFYALVETRLLSGPTTRPDAEIEDREPEAEPTTGPAMFSAATSRPAIQTRHALLRLADGFWEQFEAPVEADDGNRFWLAGWDGEAVLFWAVKTGGFRMSSWSNSLWSRVEEIDVGEVKMGWAGSWSKGPVFVAGVQTQSGAIQLTTHLRLDGKWTAERVREGSEWLQVDPTMSAVGVAQGQLCIARATKDGPIEFGSGDLGVSPDMRFAPIESRPPVAPIETSWVQAISLALLLGLLTLAMWSRREQITQLPVLPEGFMIAALWKRLVATTIDAMPAFGVFLVWYFTHLSEFPATSSLSELQQLASDDPALQAKVLQLSFATTAAYAVWCLVWELILGTTPGKRVFGCRVVHKSGGPASAGQIVVRNVIRGVMVGLGTSGWIVTLMTMVIVSRCRQRVGDLMANTIVVEPGTPPEPIVDEPPDDWSRGAGG